MEEVISKNDIKEEKRLISTKDMTLIALFAAITTACSFIRIPIGPIPFTLQTFAVFATAGILGVKRGSISMIVYVLLGAVGIPVFGGKGGYAVLAGPTGGYITGFIVSVFVAAFIIKIVKDVDSKKKVIVYFIAFVIGDLICFTMGTIQFMFLTGNDLNTSLNLCVTPFIIPDIAKAIVAVIVSMRISKVLKVME